MSRLLEVADLCSRTLSDPANRLRKTRKKKSSAVPLFRSGHMSAICARLSTGKVGVQRGRKTAGCPSFLPPRRAPRRSRRPQTANPPLRFSEKLPARKGRTRLRQFAHPAGSVQRRSRPVRANTLTQFVYPGQPVPEKSCRRFVHRHIKAKPRFPSVFFFICGGANRSCDRLRGAHRPDGFRCPT